VQVLHDPVLPVASHGSTQASSSDTKPLSDALPSEEKINNASTEFSKRMSRDNRFKKNEGNFRVLHFSIEHMITHSDTLSSMLTILNHLPGTSCGLSAVRSPLGPVREDCNSNSAKESNVLVTWESPKGDPVSPLRFDSSPKQMFRQKENLHSHLQSQSIDESNLKGTSRLNASAEKVSVLQQVTIINASNENKLPPKTRANIVSARRVISTRINTHQVRLLFPLRFMNHSYSRHMASDSDFNDNALTCFNDNLGDTGGPS
jgi:hypothetical protein